MTTGQVSATDADGDLLTFGINPDGGTTPGTNDLLYVLAGADGGYNSISRSNLI